MNNNFPQISNAVINIRVIATIVIVFLSLHMSFSRVVKRDRGRK